MDENQLRDIAPASSDLGALERLAGFVPPKVFDMHAHFYDESYLPALSAAGGMVEGLGARVDMDAYRRYQLPLYGEIKELRLNILSMPDNGMHDDPAVNRKNREASTAFLADQLERNPHCVGEAFVMADDTQDDVLSLLAHPRIRGFKCYHVAAKTRPTWQSEIDDYLPESAWEIAHERGLCITLHMVKDGALSDRGNMACILEKTKRYPNAKLILAHACRGFAPWTVMDAIDALKPRKNVYADVSAVCESPPIYALIKALGVERTLWGSDFPVSLLRGKCVSIADGFLWLYKEQLALVSGKTPFSVNLCGVENLLALQQACGMLNIGQDGVRALFYDSAMELLKLRDAAGEGV